MEHVSGINDRKLKNVMRCFAFIFYVFRRSRRSCPTGNSRPLNGEIPTLRSSFAFIVYIHGLPANQSWFPLVCCWHDIVSAGRQVGNSAGRHVAGRQVSRSASRHTGRLASRQVGRLAARHVSRSASRQVGPQVSRSAGGQVGRPPGRQVGRSAGRQVGESAGRQVQATPVASARAIASFRPAGSLRGRWAARNG